MRYHVTLDGRSYEVDLGPEGVRVDGEPVEVDLSAVPGTPVRTLLLDGRSHRLVAHRRARGRWTLHLGGRRLEAEVVDERTRRIREMTGIGEAAAGPRTVTAPMPGLVLEVEVEAGDEVEVGQGLVIVEAMKMENELRAEVDGTVRAVHVASGDAVGKNELLVEFE